MAPVNKEIPPNKKKKGKVKKASSATRTKNKTFQERLEELKTFQQRNGHCNVSKSHKDTKNNDNPDPDDIASESGIMIGEGESINTNTNTDTDTDNNNNNNAEDDMKPEDGDNNNNNNNNNTSGDNNGNDDDAASSSLGKWCANMRRNYKKFKNGKTSPKTHPKWEERFKQLDELGFTWQFVWTKTFDERVQELKAYKEIHGNCNVPRSFHENPSLGQWCSQMRSMYKANQKGEAVKNTYIINDYRIEQLETIGFKWKL
eukprot:CAMPEP_0194127598 /NCGR_PEP_ID=MMETSP0150-20130528/60611_1 /TAXON_ID=122233 /ORGANISM="Chaetoceros debilis, Strain MM31A-1" /LENGTH=258 /DNA_ID=CAMNT_0038821539 /DNA_START=656 /DNA_END=1432 /DNA_ORIENTATION=+